MLNPLQYLPVVGTIYRAITGDQIPEAARRIGSLVASALMGGPIGAVIGIVTMAAEKITGVNLDKVGQKLVTDITTGVSQVATAQPTQRASVAPLTVANTTEHTGAEAAAVDSWSPAQLTAAGITSSKDGNLQQGSLTGADVLNALELARLGGEAYGQTPEAGHPSSLNTVA